MKNYDLILIFCWENECINGSLYEDSTFHVCENGLSNIRNIPLYEVKDISKKMMTQLSILTMNRLKNSQSEIN